MLLSMLRSHLKCRVYTRRLSTRVLRKIIRVSRESLPTGHAVSVCSEFACLTRVPLIDTLHLSVAINMAVANVFCVTLSVICISCSKNPRAYTFPFILIDSLAGCFHSKEFIKHFQRSHFLSSHQDSVFHIVLNTVTD